MPTGSLMQAIKTGIAIAALTLLAPCAGNSAPDKTVGPVATVIVSTLAGSGNGFFADGQGAAASFNKPRGITLDAAGNLYVADSGNHLIRKITPKGEVSTLAGSNRDYGLVDGRGSKARFAGPLGIAIDAAGNLYVADTGNNRIRKVTPRGQVSTLAGSDDGHWPRGGFADGKASKARFDGPFGIAIDAAGNLYVADCDNNRIRKITPQGQVSTLAGGGREGFAEGFVDGPGSEARFNFPTGIAIDAAGNLYLTDLKNNCIRKVTPQGEVSTLAGDNDGMCWDTYAGEQGKAARFKGPSDIAIDAAGNLYVADRDNSGMRCPTYADGQGRAARFKGPIDIAIDAAGNLYVADSGNHLIRKITPKGEVSTLAGDGRAGFADGEGSTARFDRPTGIAIDAAGNLYVADDYNHSIRKIEIRHP